MHWIELCVDAAYSEPNKNSSWMFIESGALIIFTPGKGTAPMKNRIIDSMALNLCNTTSGR